MGFLHGDDERSRAAARRARSHRQRAGRGRLDHLPEVELARLDRHTVSAAFHRPTRRRQRALGLRIERRRARRLREEADGRLHRPRDADRGARPSRRSRRDRDHSRPRDLHSLPDALHHQPVHAAGQGRPAAGDPGRIRATSPSSASSASNPTTSSSPSNIRSARRRTRSMGCWAWIESRRRSTAASSIRACSIAHSWRCTTRSRDVRGRLRRFRRCPLRRASVKVPIRASWRRRASWKSSTPPSPCFPIIRPPRPRSRSSLGRAST